MSKVTVMPSREQLEEALVIVNKKLAVGSLVTHGSWLIFLVLVSWLNFQSDNGGVNASSIKLWLVKIIPLLLFIPGFIKKSHRTYSWLCFAVLPYFIWITPLVVGRGSWSDWVLTLLIVILFIGSMMTSRWLQQQSYLRWQIANTPSAE